MKYVVVYESDSGMFCIGICDTYAEALGTAMKDIYEFSESYEGDGDVFIIGKPDVLKGEYGEVIQVTYKAACWNQEEHNYYYIMPYSRDKKEKDI